MMFQFGLFSSHIPYAVLTVAYMLYFGTQVLSSREQIPFPSFIEKSGNLLWAGDQYMEIDDCEDRETTVNCLKVLLPEYFFKMLEDSYLSWLQALPDKLTGNIQQLFKLHSRPPPGVY